MKRSALAGLILLVSQSTQAAEFCDGSRFVDFDQLVAKNEAYVGKRVRTHAIAMTDAKEYTLFRKNEDSQEGLLESWDQETDAYAKRMGLSDQPFNVRQDLFDKLRALEKDQFKPDLTKIVYYRQVVSLCGRLVSEDGRYSFAVDDLILEKSYLLPFHSSMKN